MTDPTSQERTSLPLRNAASNAPRDRVSTLAAYGPARKPASWVGALAACGLLAGGALAQMAEPPSLPVPSAEAPFADTSPLPDAPEISDAPQASASAPATEDGVQPGDRTPQPVPGTEAAADQTAPGTDSNNPATMNADDPGPTVSPSEPYFGAVRPYLPESLRDRADVLQSATDNSARFLRDGGPAIWAIAALSVITLAIILWKIWRLAWVGAWSKGHARRAVDTYETGDAAAAAAIVARRRGVRSRVVRAAIAARAGKPDTLAREETVRVARHELAEAAIGLRALELIATIAPLLGLLGTVLGMIAAFQALQQSGSRADPALLAGGIWEALLTTAAGMAVAIPASAALSWFESVIDRMRRDVEDAVTRIFVSTGMEPANRETGDETETEGAPLPLMAAAAE
ncbi:MAG: MotA/TolQ/ExbB proton channel family protein [Jhaorihella sp.]